MEKSKSIIAKLSALVIASFGIAASINAKPVMKAVADAQECNHMTFYVDANASLADIDGHYGGFYYPNVPDMSDGIQSGEILEYEPILGDDSDYDVTVTKTDSIFDITFISKLSGHDVVHLDGKKGGPAINAPVLYVYARNNPTINVNFKGNFAFGQNKDLGFYFPALDITYGDGLGGAINFKGLNNDAGTDPMPRSVSFTNFRGASDSMTYAKWLSSPFQISDSYSAEHVLTFSEAYYLFENKTYQSALDLSSADVSCLSNIYIRGVGCMEGFLCNDFLTDDGSFNALVNINLKSPYRSSIGGVKGFWAKNSSTCAAYFDGSGKKGTFSTCLSHRNIGYSSLALSGGSTEAYAEIDHLASSSGMSFLMLPYRNYDMAFQFEDCGCVQTNENGFDLLGMARADSGYSLSLATVPMYESGTYELALQGYYANWDLMYQLGVLSKSSIITFGSNGSALHGPLTCTAFKAIPLDTFESDYLHMDDYSGEGTGLCKGDTGYFALAMQYANENYADGSKSYTPYRDPIEYSYNWKKVFLAGVDLSRQDNPECLEAFPKRVQRLISWANANGYRVVADDTLIFKFEKKDSSAVFFESVISSKGFIPAVIIASLVAGLTSFAVISLTKNKKKKDNECL